jgi:hypothetical protein
MSDTNTNTDANLTQEQRDALSAEKFRAQSGVPQGDDGAKPDDQKPTRPDDIPEKFWDAEKGEVRVAELLKSYAELEKARSKPADDQSGDNKDQKPSGSDGDADASLAEFRALREAVTEQIIAGQPITDEQYKAFEKRGLDREDVEAFIAGQEARGKLAQMEVHSEVGGEANYKAMIEWAKTAYTPAEVKAYDSDIHSFDSAVRLNAVRGLKARFESANGRTGRDVTNTGAKPGGSEAFKSKAEMVEAMRDPRYGKDAAYRESVARRIHASVAEGIDITV